MATITTNGYFQYPAEAYEGIRAQFAGLTTLANGATFTASYTSGSGTLGAKLTLECDDFSGTNHRVMNAYMSSIQGSLDIPVRMALSFGTMISQKVIAPSGGAIHWTVTQLMAALMPAIRDMIEDITDATVTLGTLQDLQFSGNPRPAIAYQEFIAVSLTDLMICHFAWVDQSMQYNQLLQTTPLYIPVQTNGISNYIVPFGQESVVPLDMDIAINNGANIFSTMSRTFTEPGS